MGDPVFVHVHEEPGELFPRYTAIEPEITGSDRVAYQALRDEAFMRAPEVRIPETLPEAQKALAELFERVVKKGVHTGAGLRRRRLTIEPELVERLDYLLGRDVVGHGPIEPVVRDPYIEDVHGLGLRDLHIVHKVFGMVHTNIRFPDAAQLNDFLEVMGERMGKPISASRPIVDGALPNGSRINVVYGDEVSKGGSSFTIRKFAETPFAITQLVDWKTMDARIAAYLWMCLEAGMNVFVSGETASGKTTTLNALLPFIHPKSKVLTAEDTPEVLPPHDNWQQLITRERGTADSRVSMYDLLKAALRSRPNYIIVGEIRGAEGSVAFQAMQAGHSTMATFHASSVSKLIQRFSSDPINVPQTFMSNLNVVLVQSAVYVNGKMLRRVLAVEEIEGFSKRSNAVITRQVFGWDPSQDRHLFAGRNNSYVLENLVADRFTLRDRREVYAELERRREHIEELVRAGKFDYHEMAQHFFAEAGKGRGKLEKEVAA